MEAMWRKFGWSKPLFPMPLFSQPQFHTTVHHLFSNNVGAASMGQELVLLRKVQSEGHCNMLTGGGDDLEVESGTRPSKPLIGTSPLRCLREIQQKDS